jgi:hypothetical protein
MRIEPPALELPELDLLVEEDQQSVHSWASESDQAAGRARKEKTKIRFFSGAKVILESSSNLKYGKVLFKRRICLKCKRSEKGHIFTFMRSRRPGKPLSRAI